MSAPMAGHRPTRFTFNIPSPTHKKQLLPQPQPRPKPQPQPQPQPKSQPHLLLKHAQHPPGPSSFLARKQVAPTAAVTAALTATTARRRPVSTPHPLPIRAKQAAASVDYSLSLQFSPSFSPSSCVISAISPTSPTDSPLSDMRQRRWSAEMLRRDGEDDSEELDDERDDDDERGIMSPDMLSSSSDSFLSPFASSSSCDTPMSSSPASPQSPAECKPSLKFPPAPLLQPHRRVQSDPLPVPAASSAPAVAFKLSLRPLVIPASRDDAIVLLDAQSPLPLCQLTDRQQSYEEGGGVQSGAGAACSGAGAAVDQLLYGRPMSLSECWYGRSELMSPVSGPTMMYMAAQQRPAHPLPFSSFYRGTAAVVL